MTLLLVGRMNNSFKKQKQEPCLIQNVKRCNLRNKLFEKKLWIDMIIFNDSKPKTIPTSTRIKYIKWCSFMSMNFRFVNVNDIEVSHSMALTVTGNI